MHTEVQWKLILRFLQICGKVSVRQNFLPRSSICWNTKWTRAWSGSVVNSDCFEGLINWMILLVVSRLAIFDWAGICWVICFILKTMVIGWNMVILDSVWFDCSSSRFKEGRKSYNHFHVAGLGHIWFQVVFYLVHLWNWYRKLTRSEKGGQGGQGTL